MQSDGLWLLALGALILVAALIAAGPPRGLDGTRMAGGRPNERLAWALNIAGAASVVTGSALLLIGNFPTNWVLWVSLAAVVVILGIGWLISAHSFARRLPFWR
jgi:hypothetical protein